MVPPIGRFAHHPLVCPGLRRNEKGCLRLLTSFGAVAARETPNVPVYRRSTSPVDEDRSPDRSHWWWKKLLRRPGDQAPRVPGYAC